MEMEIKSSPSIAFKKERKRGSWRQIQGEGQIQGQGQIQGEIQKRIFSTLKGEAVARTKTRQGHSPQTKTHKGRDRD